MELNIANVVRVLGESGAVEHKAQQETAERQLAQWETQPGYHYLLQSVYLDETVPLQTRWLAVICFKNGVEKYWRASRKNSIGKEEKTAIRKRIFDTLDEQNNQLMIQNAHSIARMSRFDFPQDWNSLFEDFGALLDKSFAGNKLVRMNNLLLVLNQVVKMLLSVRIGRIGPALLVKLPLLTPILMRLYTSCFEAWTSSWDLTLMQVGYLCLKVLRRVILCGYDYVNRNETVCEFFQLSVSHFKRLIVAYDANPLEILAKYIKCYNKIYLALTLKNCVLFVLVPSSQEILAMHLAVLADKLQLIYESDDEEFWLQLLIQIFKMLKQLLKFARTAAEGPVQLKNIADKHDSETAVALLQSQFFTEPRVQQLEMLMLQWYLKLKPQDLESWSLEPEEWVNEQNSASWEYQIRPCCENFFQDLTLSFPSTAAMVMQQIADKLASPQNDILAKDALLALYQFTETPVESELLDASTAKMFLQTFIPEALKDDSLERRVLKRRVLLIIGDRISFKDFDDGIEASYGLFLQLLQSQHPANDLVVKLTTLQVLRKLVDSFSFEKDTFKPHLNDFIGALLLISGQVQLSEVKAFILDLLGVIVAQTDPLVPQETLLQLLAMVPQLWDSSNESTEIVLKQTLVRLLTVLVTALKQDSVQSYEICVPLLSVCCSEKSQYFSILAEDGFDLWGALLVQFPNTDTLQLPNTLQGDLLLFLIEGILNSTELLATIMKIIRSYALLCPQVFNSVEFGVKYMDICANYLGKFRDDVYLIFVSTLEILVLKRDNDELFSQLSGQPFYSKLLQYITSEDAATVAESNKMLLIVSRLAYLHPQLVLSQFPSLEVIVEFLQLWILRIKTNSSLRDQKTFILGLSRVFQLLLQTESVEYFDPFAKFVHHLTQFLEETHENEHGDCEAYQLGYFYDEYNYTFDESILSTGEFKRVTQFYETVDTVHTVNLRKLVREWLSGLQTSNGEFFDRLMSSCLDVATFDQLKLIMSSR